MTKVAINGFGRIGRLSFRQLLDKEGVEVCAINDLTSVETLAHLLKYDSIHGRFPGEVSVEGGQLVVNGKTVQVSAERDPAALPWGTLGCDVVVESTGVFRDQEGAGKHIAAGARKVVISAPATGGITTASNPAPAIHAGGPWRRMPIPITDAVAKKAMGSAKTTNKGDHLLIIVENKAEEPYT